MKRFLSISAGFILALLFALASWASDFNGQADHRFDSLGYYYAITGGKFPNGQIVNGDNASGGTFRFLLDEPAWGGYPIQTWNKDDWFPQNAGLALTMKNEGAVIFDNFNNDTGDFYTTPAGQSSASTPGLYRGYCMSNNWDWIYAGYFKLDQETTIDEITGYFDENLGFDRNSPHIGYRMNIWSNKTGDLLPAVDSFSGDVFSSDSSQGTFSWGDTGVDRVFGADYGGITDDIFYLTFHLDHPITLPAGEYWFSHDAVVITPIVVTPNLVAVDTPVTLSAVVTDNGDIASAWYSLDGGETESEMDINNPYGYDAHATKTFSVSEAGVYNLCAYAKTADETGPEVCTMLVVYDPDGGFVTGGGWITSPAGAIPPTTSNVTVSGISGDTSIDPDAYYAPYMLRYVGNPPLADYDPSHNYQWGSPAIFTPSPEDGPVTLSGSIDVGAQTMGQVAMIGLLDRDDLAAGNYSFQSGAYIYIYRSSATSWKIGPSDGNDGGEIVQTFTTIADTDLPADGVLNVVFTVDGTADGTVCAVGAYTAPAGCMTLQITGGSVNATLTDSYGDVAGTNSASPEFANGAVLSWDDYLGSYVGFTLTVPSMTSGSPEGKATFGFVSKYKKGATVPTGNTEFQFTAGDLNFHSTSYDWLVVTGNNYAKFKGAGTINDANAPNGDPYKFQLWAGDGTGTDGADTFRIKIWWEEDNTEYVVYDNGMDQPISGGSIVVHAKKK